MPYVEVKRPGNPKSLDRALVEFRRAVFNAGVFREMRRTRYGMKPSEKKKWKRKEAARERGRRNRIRRNNRARF